MLKILVTGANGQLGSQLRELSPMYPDLEFLFTDLPQLDITNESAVKQMLSTFRPHRLINCAAYTAVDKAESDEKNALLLNAEAPALLAKACNEAGTKMVHISTDYVFEGTGCRPYLEDHPKKPGGVYALSKSMGEDNVRTYNTDSLIIRTSWLYSPYGANFVKTILRLVKEKKTLRIISDQVGTPTYTADLATAIIDLLTMDAPSGIYHYSNEGVCSWYDFAKAIVEIQGIECAIDPIDTAGYPLPAPRPFYSVLDKSKYKNTTGLSIPYWRDSLKTCLQILNEQI